LRRKFFSEKVVSLSLALSPFCPPSLFGKVKKKLLITAFERQLRSIFSPEIISCFLANCDLFERSCS
jgi:hypothetical protein